MSFIVSFLFRANPTPGQKLVRIGGRPAGKSEKKSFFGSRRHTTPSLLVVFSESNGLELAFVKMGGGNGAKAAQKRERNADKNKKAAGSQLKQNEAAKTIVCVLCKQAFLGTMRKPALSTHAEVMTRWIAQGC